MNHLLLILLRLVRLAVTAAAASEILGYRIGLLDGPRWVNVWQYVLLTFAACCLLGMRTDHISGAGRRVLKYFSFSLLIWTTSAVLPLVQVMSRSGWNVSQPIIVIGAVSMVVGADYLIIRLMIVPFRLMTNTAESNE